MPPRGRSQDNAWLKDYPGLHIYPDGRFYVVHPLTKKQASLKTRDRTTALQLYALVSADWKGQRVDAMADAVVKRLSGLAIPRTEHDDLTFREYARHWRENLLGFVVNADGSVTRRPTKLTKKNKGDPIEPRTQTDYGRQCRQLELSEDSDFRLSLPEAQLLHRTRKLLAAWADKPVHYNHMMAVVAHIYRAAIREGVAGIARNPVSEIEKLGTSKRKVYIPDAHYVAITQQLMVHVHNGKTEDGEWRARICDLLYMLSSRPVDIFRISEANLRLPVVNMDLPEVARDYGSIAFEHTKTDVGQVIDMNADMREVVDWFLAFKRQHRIFNKKALLCYPPYMGRQAGKPVTHRTMWQYFHDAAVAAGFKGQYQLRDLRKKGLTDEFVNQGENDKGGHLTQRQADDYRLHKPPKRAKNTLVDLRKVVGK